MWAAGEQVVCGIDEVGRGAWAGPVTVAAVVPAPEHLRGVRDSKQLDRAHRELAAASVRGWAVAIGVGHASHIECDELGMTAALRAAGPARARAARRAGLRAGSRRARRQPRLPRPRHARHHGDQGRCDVPRGRGRVVCGQGDARSHDGRRSRALPAVRLRVQRGLSRAGAQGRAPGLRSECDPPSFVDLHGRPVLAGCPARARAVVRSTLRRTSPWPSTFPKCTLARSTPPACSSPVSATGNGATRRSCDGWTVRELVNHIVTGNYWADELAGGKTIAEVGDVLRRRRPRRRSRRRLRRVGRARGRGVPGTGCDGRAVRGVVRAGAGLDLLRSPLHGRAHPRLGRRAVDGAGHHAAARSRRRVLGRARAAGSRCSRRAGCSATAVPVADDADAQTRLLAVLGRRDVSRASFSAVGQFITVTVRAGASPSVRMFDTNRSLTGMAIERYSEPEQAAGGDRAPDVLAARLFAMGATKVTVYSNVVSVEAPPELWPELEPKVDRGDRAPLRLLRRRRRLVAGVAPRHRRRATAHRRARHLTQPARELLGRLTVRTYVR